MAAGICDQGLAYWQRLKGDRLAPHRAEFDPVDIPSLLPNLIFMEVVDDGQDFVFRVIGDDVRRYMFDNYTGKRFSSLEHIEPDGPILSRMRWVAREGQVLREPSPYVGPHKDVTKRDDILLPLLNDAGAVGHILVFLEFGRINPFEHQPSCGRNDAISLQ